jgi:hypothetical protein
MEVLGELLNDCLRHTQRERASPAMVLRLIDLSEKVEAERFRVRRVRRLLMFCARACPCHRMLITPPFWCVQQDVARARPTAGAATTAATAAATAVAAGRVSLKRRIQDMRYNSRDVRRDGLVRHRPTPTARFALTLLVCARVGGLGGYAGPDVPSGPPGRVPRIVCAQPPPHHLLLRAQWRRPTVQPQPPHTAGAL